MFLTCPTLAALPSIRHGFFTRKDGKSTGLYESLNCGYGSGDDIDTVRANRALVASAMGVEVDALCTAYQIHSAKVITLTTPWHWKEAPEADALVTATPGIALGILTADCIPILFADTKQQVIGAAHAGWKGAIGGIAQATIAAMEQLGANREDIAATVGPAIAQHSYEVGVEFRDRFLAESSGNTSYFSPSPRPEHFLFDLKGYAKQQLESAGITQINVLPNDTRAEDGVFFSFRRATLQKESAYGRQISVISLPKL